MKAAQIHTFGGIETIQIEEVPIPTPQDHEVQIAVKYAGVNPVDWKIAEGFLKTRMDYRFPITLGWDVAGEISQIGKQVTQFKKGDPIFAYCRKEIIHDGSFAEYLCLPEKQVVSKPSSLTFAEAAATPLCALTAWQSLFEAAQLKANDSILIHAGAGGVGGFAIQFAKQCGAYVVTTASQGNFDYVKILGADQVIDYTQENFVDAIHKHFPKGVDVVFDTVGGTTLRQSYAAIKEGGRLITIAGVIDLAVVTHKRIFADFVFVRPDREHLTKIAHLIDQKKVIPPRIQEALFKDVEKALRKNREGHTQGKIVLKM